MGRGANEGKAGQLLYGAELPRPLRGLASLKTGGPGPITYEDVVSFGNGASLAVCPAEGDSLSRRLEVRGPRGGIRLFGTLPRSGAEAFASAISAGLPAIAPTKEGPIFRTIRESSAQDPEERLILRVTGAGGGNLHSAVLEESERDRFGIALLDG